LTASSTIEVPYEYGTIQEAIDSANQGDTIYVYNGTYHEHLEVNKSISLIGQDPDITVIDGDDIGTVVHVSADNVSVLGFTIGHGQIGIHLQNSTNSVVEKNTIESNFFDGIKAEFSKNITIENNSIGGNSQNGIFLQNSDNNLLFHNDITCNSRMSNGILLIDSGNNVVSCNSVTGVDPEGNEGGITLLYSHNNSISRNLVVKNNWSGIDLRYSNNTLIWGNTMVRHNWFGMRLTYSYENLIYWNNFVENHVQVSVDSANETWSSQDLGNYWSDYRGSDYQPDGIGDQPYKIDDINIDNYPLMGEFSDFTVFNEANEAVSISIVSNSTISDFTMTTYFNPETGQNASLMEFNVTGNFGTGFCRISIPHTILEGPYAVTVDGSSPTMIKEITSNLTHTILYFTYYNPKQVIIVPGFSPAVFLLLFMLTTLLVTLIRTGKLNPRTLMKRSRT
jgi:parallel beta-helix repeat protein